MTLRRIDQVMVTLGLLLILISSYQLFFKSNKSDSGIALGTLTSKISVVKTKNALALGWQDGLIGNGLFEDQLIYTDSNSSAGIQFKEGNQLQISQNSLVRLRSNNKQNALNVSRGFMQAKLKGNESLIVQLNGKDFHLTGKDTDIQINLHDKSGEIGVLKGELKVEGNGIKESINTSSALQLDENSVQKKSIYFKTVSPARNSIQYVPAIPNEIKFEWHPKEMAKLAISKSPNLTNSQIIEDAGETIVPFQEGNYYYRIENDNGTSLTSSIKVILEKAPQLLRPLDGERYEVLKETPKILLQWNDDSKDNYLIEWGSESVNTQKVSGASLEIETLSDFRWRIKIDDEKRPHAVWSDWQHVQVSLLDKPGLPFDLTPHEVEYQTYQTPEEKVELKWQGPPLAIIEIVEPDNKILTKKITGNHFEYTAIKAGNYKWRVRSIDNLLRTSEWSEWKTFSIADLSQDVDPAGFQRVQLKKPDQAVTFNWETKAGVVTVFELAEDISFKSIVKKSEVKEDFIKVSVPKIGTYFWRSRQFLLDGTVHVGEPKRVIIEPVPAPEKPDKLPDTEVPLEDLPVKRETSFWDYFISPAYADDLRGMAKLTLAVTEEAKGFEIRIYQDEALQNLIYETVSSSKEFEWKGAKPGTYYWQYAVIDFWDRKSPFSDPAKLVVTGELIPDPVKPKLLKPIRAVEVEKNELTFSWSKSDFNEYYILEISDNSSFEKILLQERTNKTELSPKLELPNQKLHFWRVRAFNKKGRENISNTGRFSIKPPLERLIIADQFPWTKEWNKRLSIAWTPSIDKYNFTVQGNEGDISGVALMGIDLLYTHFLNQGSITGEVLRQSGKVYEDENYLFQRVSLDYVYLWGRDSHHRYGFGLLLGQSSGNNYELENQVIVAQSVSGLSYGPILRDYYVWNQHWEMQSKLSYLLGEVKQLDISSDILKHQKKFFFSGGVGFAQRTYPLNSGDQSSLKISIGIGKEF